MLPAKENKKIVLIRNKLSKLDRERIKLEKDISDLEKQLTMKRNEHDKIIKSISIAQQELERVGDEACIEPPKIYKKSDHINIVPRDMTDQYVGRDIEDVINSQSQIVEEKSLQSTFQNDENIATPTPLSNTLFSPKCKGIFNGLAFVFCGFDAKLRRTYRTHVLGNGGSCFSIQELQPWSNTRENQEYNMRMLLKFLKELNYNWVLIWSSKLPYLQSSRRFLIKTGEANTVNVINETWLIDALSMKELGELDKFEYKPFRHLLPLIEFENLVIAVTGYDNKYRLTIKNLIKILGGTFVDAFTDKVSYLVAPKPGDFKNAKIMACGKYNIPIVTKEWLHQCVNVGKKVDIEPFKIQHLISKEVVIKSIAKPLQGIKLVVLDELYRGIAKDLGAILVVDQHEGEYAVAEPHGKIGNYARDVFVDPKWLTTCQKLEKLVPVDHFIWKKKRVLIEPIIPHKRKMIEKKHDVSYE